MKAFFNSFTRRGRVRNASPARRRTRFESLERRYALDGAAPAALVAEMAAATEDASGSVDVTADDAGMAVSENSSADTGATAPVDLAPVESALDSVLDLSVSQDAITISVSFDAGASGGADAGGEGNVTISVSGLDLHEIDVSGVQDAALNLVSSVADVVGSVLDSLGSIDVSADADVDDGGGSVDVSADSGLWSVDGSVSADAPLDDLLDGVGVGDVTQLINTGDLTGLVNDVLSDVSLSDLSSVVKQIDPSGLLGGLNLGDLLGAVDASGHADAEGIVNVDDAGVDAGAAGDASFDLGGVLDTVDPTGVTGSLGDVDAQTVTSLLQDVLPGDLVDDLDLGNLTDPLNMGRVNGLLHSLGGGALPGAVNSGAVNGLVHSLTGGNSPVNLGRVNGLLNSLGAGNVPGDDDDDGDLPDLPPDLLDDLNSSIDGVAGDVTSALSRRGLMV